MRGRQLERKNLKTKAISTSCYIKYRKLFVVSYSKKQKEDKLSHYRIGKQNLSRLVKTQ